MREYKIHGGMIANMKKRNKIIMIIIFWVVVVVVLHSLGLITTDLNKINLIIGNNPFKMRCLFIFLSTVRVAFFIPQTIFIICGSMIFGPYEGFLLSVLSLAILKKHGYKVLALGIACPVTPSDLITVLAACIKLKYKKCIATIVMADSPMIFMYGFLGNGFQKTAIFKVISIVAVIAIAFVSYYTFYMWNKIKESL